MLAADKLQLQSLMKQQAVTLKEKEFNLHHSNCMTIGTQAAVLAGLDITMFIEFTPISLRDFIFGPELTDAVVTHSHHAAAASAAAAAAATSTVLHPQHHHHVRSLAAIVTSAAVVASRNIMKTNIDDGSDSHDSNDMSTDTTSSILSTEPNASNGWMQQEYIAYYTLLYHVLHFLYYSLICTAFCCNVIVVAQTTILSVLGAGLALRGPDGSMMTATNILYQERSDIFRFFGYGLTFTILSVFVGVWLMFQHWATALSCWLIASYTCYFIYTNYQRVSKLLYFADNESVDLHDLLSITQQRPHSTTTTSNTGRSKVISFSTGQSQRHQSHHNSNGSVVTGDDDYDDDDTMYSSENPETESFINHRINVQQQQYNNNSRRRRSKYSQHNNNNNSNRNDVIASIQMV